MANQFPLQPGDKAPDLSDQRSSTEADRREQRAVTAQALNKQNYHGEYPAADQSRAEGGRLWKVAQATPSEFLSAPYPVIRMDGDNNGMPAEVREINILNYGDGYDTTAPLRVRTVAPSENIWNLDSDQDGQRN